jgi:predicted dehydrogenase
MSAVTAQLGPRLRVLGDQAAYTKYGLDVQEQALVAGERPDRDGWGEDRPEHFGRLGVDGDLREIRTEPGRYQDFYAGVVAALRDGAPMPVDPAESVAALEIIEAAHRQTRS